MVEADIRYPTDAGLRAMQCGLLPRVRLRGPPDRGDRQHKRGARGLIMPPKLQAGSTHEHQLLPQAVGDLVDLNLTLKEAAFDAGLGPTQAAPPWPG